MTRPADPDRREIVIAHLEDMDHIQQVAHKGPGVVAEKTANQGKQSTFTNFIEQHGWYVASYYCQQGGDLVTFMPIPEAGDE
jgi:hypothetical protein